MSLWAKNLLPSTMNVMSEKSSLFVNSLMFFNNLFLLLVAKLNSGQGSVSNI